MKDISQIEERLNRLVIEALDARMTDIQVRLPGKCRHNHRQPLDHRKTVYGGANPTYNRISTGAKLKSQLPEPVDNKLGLCMFNGDNPAEWNGDLCEDPVDAQRCSKYDPIVNSKEIYDTFCKGLKDTEWLEANLPEVQSLLWVLGVGLDPEKDEPEPVPQLPSFWKRLADIFNPKVPELPQLPELPDEGEPADIKVYLPTFKEYSPFKDDHADHSPGTVTDN